jgi:hypothetical protein
MMTQQIEVYFFGLICHIGPDDQPGMHNAAIPHLDGHVPMVHIGGMAQPIELENGDVLSLSLGRGDALADASFLAYVPSLRRYTDKPGGNQSLEGGVRTSTNFAAATAYFEYPRCSVRTAQLYKPDAGLFTMTKKQPVTQCVARMTVAVAEASEAVKLLRKNGDNTTSYPIDQGWLLISNGIHDVVSNETAPGSYPPKPRTKHFPAHRRLTDATEIADVEPFKDGCKEQLRDPEISHLADALKIIDAVAAHQAGGLLQSSDVHIFVATQVDCAETRWP